jgi:immune inhibitor A
MRLNNSSHLKKATLMFLLIVIAVFASAVPSLEKPFEYEQPDGTVIQLLGRGDEFFSYYEDSRGNLVVFDRNSGYWCYALLADGMIIPSPSRVGIDKPMIDTYKSRDVIDEIRDRYLELSEMYAYRIGFEGSTPSIGVIRLPVILINFTDTTTTNTPNEFRNLVFAESGLSSVRDYYFEVSYGSLTIQGDVFGWYKADKNHDYYGIDDYHARELALEAVKKADPSANFSLYDNDKDGNVDIVIVIHQGRGREESGSPNDIHSHHWVIPSYKTDGVTVNSYTMQPERYENGITTIGVIAHELGHALGLPDLYDTTGKSEGIGEWGLMGSGSWLWLYRPGDCPSHMTAWSKVKLGWLGPVDVSAHTGFFVLKEVEKRQSSLVYFKAGSQTEYFLAEFRDRGGFDVGLPGEGVIVYHIDDTQSGNTNVARKLVDVEEADGLDHLDKNINRGDAGDLFSKSGDLFSNTSTPNSKWYSGINSGFGLSNFVNAGQIDKATSFIVLVGQAAPSELRLESFYDGKPRLIWNDNTDELLIWNSRTGKWDSMNENGFEIYRKTVNTSYTRIADVDAGENSFIDNSAQPNTLYCYKVRAFKMGDSSDCYTPYSNELCITVPGTQKHNLTVTTFPYTGLDLKIDGTTYTSPRTLSVDKGTSHTIQVISPQEQDDTSKVSGTDMKYTFEKWTDGNTANPRTVTVNSDVTYTAQMKVECKVETATQPSGITTIAGSGWYIQLTKCVKVTKK